MLVLIGHLMVSMTILFISSVNCQGISWSEFESAITSCGFGSPRSDQLTNFVGAVNKFGLSKRDAAMLLANVILETGGLKKLVEENCVNTGCPGQYYDAQTNNCGHPEKSYFGRGYVQLSWCYNYRDAGPALGQDFLNNPQLVSDKEEYAWGTATWFWNERVRNFWKADVAAGVRAGQFGSAIKAINGGYECPPKPGYGEKRAKRIQYYQNVYKAFRLEGANGPPNLSGCEG